MKINNPHTPAPWILEKDIDDELVILDANYESVAYPIRGDIGLLLSQTPRLLLLLRQAKTVIDECIPNETNVPVPGIAKFLREYLTEAEKLLSEAPHAENN